MSATPTPRRGEDVHHLIIQEIEMTFAEVENAAPAFILIATDEHNTTYRFNFTLELLDQEQHTEGRR